MTMSTVFAEFKKPLRCTTTKYYHWSLFLFDWCIIRILQTLYQFHYTFLFSFSRILHQFFLKSLHMFYFYRRYYHHLISQKLLLSHFVVFNELVNFFSALCHKELLFEIIRLDHTAKMIKKVKSLIRI